MDQYEKDRDNKLESCNQEKEKIKSKIEKKNKKIEIIYRELNELRTKEGKGEANMEQISEDPK